MCEKVTGKAIPAVEKPRRPGDPPKLVAAAGKAIRELGWKPQFPKLEDIVATAWAWHESYPEGYTDRVLRKVLLVDDDPIVLRLYQGWLSRRGVHVDTASDGFAAVQALRACRPDLVVLDLMMPKFTGVDVLKFLRAQPDFAELPVIVLSNHYMNEMARQAVSLGVEKALLKVRCSPPVLMGIINDLFAGKPTSEDRSHLLVVPREDPADRADSAAPPAPSPAAPAQTPAPAAAAPPPTQTEDPGATAQFQAKARHTLLENASVTCSALRSLHEAFTDASNPTARGRSLQNFYRKVHFIAAAAGLAECHQLAQMASALEALLFELADKPASVTPSALRTVGATVDFIGLLFDRARDSGPEVALVAQTLVVDDDALSNRLVVTALRRAGLAARSAVDPLVALQWIEQKRYDLVLLDIEMPGMDGFEFCRRLRQSPGYEKTPVIYVTAHDDFESRAKSILSSGGDLISKPVFPLELAVKALTHLLRTQLST